MSERAIKRWSDRERKRLARRRRTVAATAAATGAAIAIAAPSANAANFEVTNLNDTGAGSLRDAIDQANSAGGADTITFQSGLSGTINVGSQMEITDTLAIQGPGSDAVTLDGGDATRILHTDSSSDLDVSGLTFTHGDAGTNSGGAIAAYGQHLGLDDVVISHSSASRGGGAYLLGNDVDIKNSTFANNYASYSGGGFTSDGDSSADGSTQEVSITGSTVTGNTSVSNGGGMALYDNYVPTTVDTSTFSGNTVTGSGGKYQDGGGVWIEDTYYGYPTTVSNSTFTGNSTPDSGGGISFGENFYGPTQVINSTITDNSAGFGAGVQFADLDNSSYDPSSTFSLLNSTVTGNDATSNGGGVWLGYAITGYPFGTDGDLEISSSIVSNNTAPDSPDLGQNPYATGSTSAGNSLLANPSGATYTEDPSGSVLTGVYPQLMALADNGGPTETRLPAASSPVINAGLANGLTEDQRGENRTVHYPQKANSLGSDGTDMGAVELSAPPNTVITSGPANGSTITTNQATFGFAGDPAADTVRLQCKLDSGDWFSCHSTRSFFNLADGTHTFQARAIDANGNGDPTPASRTFTVAVDREVKDPFLKMKDPQLQSGKKIKIRVKAGAGEDVTAIASGKVQLNHGNAVKLESAQVAAGERVTLVLRPQPGSGGNHRIKKALRNGRTPKAKIRGRLKDDAGNKFAELLTAKLKLKK